MAGVSCAVHSAKAIMRHLCLDLSCMERRGNVCTYPKTREPRVRRSYVVDFASGKPSMHPFWIPQHLFPRLGIKRPIRFRIASFLSTHHVGSLSKHAV
eukprot:scaffold649_cov347-Pavlova_lutheri.AAC.122